MARYIGIDFGAAVTRLCTASGIIAAEPSVIAAEIYNGGSYASNAEYIAVGNEAFAIFKNTPGSVALIKPFFDDKTEDFSIIYEYADQLLYDYGGDFPIHGARVIVAVPEGMPAAGIASIRDALYDAGAKSIGIVPSAVAAALGAGVTLPHREKGKDSTVGTVYSRLVIDIGADTVKLAIINNSGIGYSSHIYEGGTSCDFAVADKIRKLYGSSVEMVEAERIKCTVGTAYPLTEEIYDTALCRSAFSGLPREVKVTSDVIRPALFEQCEFIIEAIKNALNRVSPSLLSELCENGILLTGGGAKLTGIAEFIHDFTDIDATVAENPEQCTALGIVRMIHEPEYLQYAVFDK